MSAFWWAAAMLLLGHPAHAAITCSLGTPAAVSFAYVASTGGASVTNVQQGAITATCTRTASADPTTLTLADNKGLYAVGQSNNVQLTAGGTNYKVSYDLYQDSLCTTEWRSNVPLSATLSATTLNTPVTATFRYWACKLSAQALTGYPAGLYTDRVDLTLSAGGSAVATAALNISMYAPATCSISTAPGNLTFTYTAFAPSAAFAGTSFKASCTNLLPYTMSLSPREGVVAGLRYSLGLSLSNAGSAGNFGPASLPAQGNSLGVATHYINGSMPAAQAGQHGTVVPQVHTLTLTY